MEAIIEHKYLNHNQKKWHKVAWFQVTCRMSLLTLIFYTIFHLSFCFYFTAYFTLLSTIIAQNGTNGKFNEIAPNNFPQIYIHTCTTPALVNAVLGKSTEFITVIGT